MRLNNKGVTLIEIVVSITLISIVLVFLFRLLITLKEIDDKSLSKLEYEEKTSLIMKSIQDEIKDTSDCSFTSSNSTLEIDCDIIINLTIRGNTINVEIDGDTKTYKFPNDTKRISSIVNNSNDILYKYNLDVIDDKDNKYPIEIVYLKQS